MKIILSLFLLIVFSCSQAFAPRAFPIYGNYCGNGNPKILQEAPPINTIDFLCQERLFCLKKNFKNSKPCDNVLAFEMDKVHATTEEEKMVKKQIIRYFGQ